MENVTDGLAFLSATRCDFSTELEFIVSHFCGFLCRGDGLKALACSMIHEIISHASLRLDSADSLDGLTSKGIETDPEMFGLQIGIWFAAF
jgi:hypothetical protein